MIEKTIEGSDKVNEALGKLWEKYGCREETMGGDDHDDDDDDYEEGDDDDDDDDGKEEITVVADESADCSSEFEGGCMDLLKDGLKAVGGLFWACENLLGIKEQYETLEDALYSIYDSRELESVLGCVNDAMNSAVGLADGTCVKYSSVPRVLRTTIVVGKRELSVAEFALEKLGGADLMPLYELREKCVLALGCSPDLLASRLVQVDYTYLHSVRDIKRMNNSRTKAALLSVCEKLNAMLDEVRGYGFKTTESDIDFGTTTGALIGVCGKYGEDDFEKGSTAEAIVSNTIEIIEILGERMKAK